MLACVYLSTHMDTHARACVKSCWYRRARVSATCYVCDNTTLTSLVWFGVLFYPQPTSHRFVHRYGNRCLARRIQHVRADHTNDVAHDYNDHYHDHNTHHYPQATIVCMCAPGIINRGAHHHKRALRNKHATSCTSQTAGPARLLRCRRQCCAVRDHVQTWAKRPRQRCDALIFTPRRIFTSAGQSC